MAPLARWILLALAGLVLAAGLFFVPVQRVHVHADGRQEVIDLFPPPEVYVAIWQRSDATAPDVIEADRLDKLLDGPGCLRYDRRDWELMCYKRWDWWLGCLISVYIFALGLLLPFFWIKERQLARAPFTRFSMACLSVYLVGIAFGSLYGLVCGGSLATACVTVLFGRAAATSPGECAWLRLVPGLRAFGSALLLMVLLSFCDPLKLERWGVRSELLQVMAIWAMFLLVLCLAPRGRLLAWTWHIAALLAVFFVGKMLSLCLEAAVDWIYGIETIIGGFGPRFLSETTGMISFLVVCAAASPFAFLYNKFVAGRWLGASSRTT